MSMKYCKSNPGTLIVLGIILGAFLLTPVCYAGGAVILVPAEDNDVPQGSYIPERRTKKIEKKVKEFKAKMKEKSIKQQQEKAPMEKTPKPKALKEK